MAKVGFFTHGSQFDGPEDVRDWLDVDLRIRLNGKYTMDRASRVGSLEVGAVVFFHKKRWVVGYAVVEEERRALRDSETEVLRGKNVVKFVPESIVALREEQWIPLADISEITGKELQDLQNFYVTLDEENDRVVFDIFKAIAERPRYYT